MANPERGETALTIGEHTYVLSYSLNALCEVEELLGETIIVTTLRFEEGRSGLRELRAITWGGLIDKAPKTTLLEAGVILQEGLHQYGAKRYTELLFESLQRSFPTPANRPLKPATRKHGATSIVKPSSQGSTPNEPGD